MSTRHVEWKIMTVLVRKLSFRESLMRQSENEHGDRVTTTTLSVSDEVAIERLRGGDTCAYEIIMRRYNQRLFRVARSILRDEDAAQDAVQEAYLSAFFKLEQYSPTGSFGAWLTRITVNEALMIKRKERRNEKHHAQNNSEVYETDVQSENERMDPASVIANCELGQLIEEAVDQLPDDFRTVFVLRAIQQLNVKETANSLDIKEATVKTRFHRARNLMQEALNRQMDAAGLHAFKFAGQRCDIIVETVLKRLGVDRGNSDDLKPFH